MGTRRLTCSFCEQDKPEEFLINPAGGFGRKNATWACEDCMWKAEPGSRLQHMRVSLYADHFYPHGLPEDELPFDGGVY